VQCHPEFKSKPTAAHPLFRAFVEASLGRRERKRVSRPNEPEWPLLAVDVPVIDFPGIAFLDDVDVNSHRVAIFSRNVKQSSEGDRPTVASFASSVIFWLLSL